MTKVIHMDLGRCIYCRACEVACEREHGGISHMFVQLIDERYAVPMNCRHCEVSPCTLICPTKAVHRETEDAVTVDSMKCIGCKLCTLACPFGVIWPDLLNKVSRKCDLCIHRTRRGLDPACVTTCSARALVFGEFGDVIARARAIPATTFVNRASGKVGTVVTMPRYGVGKAAENGEER
jgi:formate dehydrogenase iron-sulfur subunit